MRVLFSFCLLCSLVHARAQKPDFDAADRVVNAIPAASTSNTADIANYIKINLQRPVEQVYAAYRWVSSNITYDVDSMYVFNTRPDTNLVITAALRRRKGVCENYAAMFADIAMKCGFNATIVKGYTKQGGVVDRSGHTWAAVELDQAWSLYDPTWDAGNRAGFNYFMISPGEFIRSHFPFDPLWQLLDSVVSPQAFLQGDYHQTFAGKETVKRNLAQWKKLGKEELISGAIRRMESAGDVNPLSQTHLAWLKMQAAILKEDEHKAQYDLAVENVNKSTVLLNEFIGIRNAGFVPARPDGDLLTMLDASENYLSLSSTQCRYLRQSTAGMQYDTGELEDRIQRLEKKLRDQQSFLHDRIVAAAAPEKIHD